jgi:AcrR family transcriptional regulator
MNSRAAIGKENGMSSRADRKRGRGQPRARGEPDESGADGRERGDGTASALLRAGRELFARRGYDGASVRAITRAASANLGAITYHFGSKRGLYDAVVDGAVAPLAERVVSVAVGPGSTLDRLEAVVRTYFEHLRSHPDLPFLMMQELAAGRSPPEPAARAMGRISAALTDLVSEGQASGEVREGDAMLLALSVVSQPLHMTVARRVLLVVAGIDTEDGPQYERLIAHASAFVRAGLAGFSSAAGEEVDR